MLVKESMESITEYLEKSLSTKTVIGEPQHVGDITLIPVMDVAFGFGAGGGEGGAPGEKGGTGTGSGGGAGARMSARAIIVIKGNDVSILPMNKGGGFEKLVDAVPGLIEKLATIQEKRKAEKKEEPAPV